MEFDSFGFYLSDHPSKFYKTLHDDKNVNSIRSINDIKFDSNLTHQTFSLICLISELNQRTSKQGKNIAF